MPHNKKMKVPSLPSLMRMVDAIDHNHRWLFSEEATKWCSRYAAFLMAVSNNPNGPEAAWRQRASDILHPPLPRDYADIEYWKGYATGMSDEPRPHGDNEHFRQGWIDAMHYRGKVTRVN